MKQKIFLKDYVSEFLKKNVDNGDISSYQKDKFIFDENATFSTEMERSDDLLEVMLKHATPEGDYEAAIALYEAFPELTLEQAQYAPFWAYLTHVDLYP